MVVKTEFGRGDQHAVGSLSRLMADAQLRRFQLRGLLVGIMHTELLMHGLNVVNWSMYRRTSHSSSVAQLD